MTPRGNLPSDAAPISSALAGAQAPLPLRRGDITLAELIDLYFQGYAGRDTTRAQRLSWWRDRVGQVRLQDLSDDEVHAELEALADSPARVYCGKDADGKAIFRAKGSRPAPATVNRYAAALSAVITWSIKRRIAPKGYVHPCRSIELRAENNARTRFLTEDERDRLLQACKASKWPRMYLFVLMAISTGARRGELLALRFADIDLARRVALVRQTKIGEPRVLPLIASVVEILEREQGRPAELVFGSRRTPGKPFHLNARWAEAVRTARLRGVSIHTLRHSCASFLAKSGATLLEIGDALGHRQIATTRRYAHLATSHRAALIERVLGDLR